jgi:DNA-binding GntR family transcriptional regulator
MTSSPAPVLETSVMRCLDAIRQMILTGQLLPGETVRQSAIAAVLGTSRIPVREALTTLQSEGVVVYAPHVGYHVAKFNAAELSEIYLMRRMLEAELLADIDLPAVDTRHLESVNEQLRRSGSGPDYPAADGTGSLWDRKQLNREFHFHLFELSPRKVILGEVERLWNMSEFYRSLYAYEENEQQQITAEHDRIIDAIRSGSLSRLLDEVNRHRGAAEEAVVRRLGPIERARYSRSGPANAPAAQRGAGQAGGTPE